MYDDITFHIPESYREEFKSRYEYGPWEVLTMLEDVKEFHITEDNPTKSSELRSSETSREPRSYRFIFAEE